MYVYVQNENHTKQQRAHTERKRKFEKFTEVKASPFYCVLFLKFSD